MCPMLYLHMYSIMARNFMSCCCTNRAHRNQQLPVHASPLTTCTSCQSQCTVIVRYNSGELRWCPESGQDVDDICKKLDEIVICHRLRMQHR